jgi:hypothetical protein
MDVYGFFPSATVTLLKLLLAWKRFSVWRKNKQFPSSVPFWQTISTLLPESHDVLPSEAVGSTFSTGLWNWL